MSVILMIGEDSGVVIRATSYKAVAMAAAIHMNFEIDMILVDGIEAHPAQIVHMVANGGLK